MMRGFTGGRKGKGGQGNATLITEQRQPDCTTAEQGGQAFLLLSLRTAVQKTAKYQNITPLQQFRSTRTAVQPPTLTAARQSMRKEKNNHFFYSLATGRQDPTPIGSEV